MSVEFTVWSTVGDRRRFFLVPIDHAFEPGDTAVRAPLKNEERVSADDLAVFEITEQQAHRWATAELAGTLNELKANMDAGLAKFRAQLAANDQKPVDASSPITPNAASAILDFFTALPRVVGQGISGDETRVAAARQKMADLQQRLKESGVDVDDRLQQFPERLAELRKVPQETGKKPEQ